MVQIKALLLAAVFAIVCKAEDPYDNIGPCRQDILDQRYKGFNIETVSLHTTNHSKSIVITYY